MAVRKKNNTPSIEELQARVGQLESELKKVTFNFSAALEQGNAVVYSRNFESDTYDFMGDGIKEITGYAPEEMTPALFDSISIGAEPQGELAAVDLGEAYRRNRTGVVNHWVADTKIRTKLGDIKYILDVSTLLRDQAGRTYGTLGILFDITERKLMEQQLVKTTQELRLKNEDMELDLETAREIQLTLIAQNDRRFPLEATGEQSLVRFYDLYIPARKLSGDFFQVLPISRDIVGVLIGDVMGHGVRASLVTAFVRGLLEEIIPLASENDRVLQKLNDGLFTVLSRSRTSSFVTAVYMTIDVRKRVIRYANAGHPQPLFVNKSAGPIPAPFPSRKDPEPALGLLKGFPYTVCTRPIVHDDVIYLYTDGVHDVKNPAEQFYGKNRLVLYVNDNYRLPPDELLDTLLAGIKAHAGERKDFDDDLCMVAAHFTDR